MEASVQEGEEYERNLCNRLLSVLSDPVVAECKAP